MNHEDQTIEHQSSKNYKLLIGLVVVAALMLCGFMSFAGFAIGRATVASEAEPTVVIQQGEQPDDAADIASEVDTAVSEAAPTAPQTVEEPITPTEPPVATTETQPEVPTATPRLEDIEEIDFATDQEIDERKMRRAKLKDYIYHLLRHAPAACPTCKGTGVAHESAPTR